MSYLSHFEDIDLKFCTHIHQPLPSNILSGFLKILILRGGSLKKKKNLENFENFEEFSNFLKSKIAVL